MKVHQQTEDGKYRMTGYLLYELANGSYYYVFRAPPEIKSIQAAVRAYEERECQNFIKRSDCINY